MYDKNSRARTYKPYVSQHLGDLIQFAQCVSGAEATQVDELCQVVLHHPPDYADELGRQSGLNWNGSPLQFLISARRNGSVFRFVGDPAFYYSDPVMRFEESKKALYTALDAGDAGTLREICGRSLKSIIPGDPEALEEFTHGMIWLALSFNQPGAAAYFLAVSDRSVAWRTAHQWADTIFPHPEEAHRVITTLEPNCCLLFVGIEGQTPESGRAKLYWRLSRPATFSQFGIKMYEDPVVLRFLAALMKEHPFSLYALTFSAGFSLKTGELTDIKVDVSNRSVNLSVVEAIDFVELQAQTLGLQRPPTREGLMVSRDSVFVGFVGLGLSYQRDYRLNMYLFQTNRLNAKN